MTRGDTAEATTLRGAPRAVHVAARLGFARDAAIALLRLTYRSSRPLVSNRHELPILLNRRGLVATAAEVGVRAGEFSESILERWEGGRLISVDPWAEALDDDYVDIANVGRDDHERLFAATRSRLGRFGDRSSIWRMTGDEAAEQIAHRSLDFVYLDARHDRASVERDLATWLPRVRPGGIIGGHDYLEIGRASCRERV